MGLSIARSVVCLHRRVPVGACVCTGVLERACGAHGEEVGGPGSGTRWPSPGPSLGCSSPRGLAAPTALKRRQRKSLALLWLRLTFGMPRAPQMPLAPPGPFSLFPSRSGVRAVPPRPSHPCSPSALLPLPPPRTQTLLSRKVAKGELQENFAPNFPGSGELVLENCVFWQRWQHLSTGASGSVASKVNPVCGGLQQKGEE